MTDLERDKQLSDKLERDTLQSNEVKRLTKLFADIPENKKKLCTKLIQNAAFMSVTMEELQETINLNGVTEKYQNGANQSGIKKSAEIEIYNNFIKQYTVIIRQLTELLSKSDNGDPDDGFAELMKK